MRSPAETSGKTTANPPEPPAKGLPAASEKVWKAVVEGLFEGRFVPGQRLVESELVEQFKVSRGSVREAISRLASDGIVTTGRFRGAEVRRLSIQETIDILLVVEMALGLAARLAAERLARDEQALALKSCLRTLEDLQGALDTLDGIRARNIFYRNLTQIGGNAELARILPSLRIHLVRLSYLPPVGIPARTRINDYRQIVRAILNRNPALAEKVARKHVSRLTELIQPQDTVSHPSKIGK